MSKAKAVSVWLGSRASVWAHRGYRVCSEWVSCESLTDARRVVRQSLGGRVYTVKAPDGEYCYTSLKGARADDSGVSADAVIDLDASWVRW